MKAAKEQLKKRYESEKLLQTQIQGKIKRGRS